MTNQEASNRIVKALAMARVMHDDHVTFAEARQVALDQGPFWSAVVKKAGYPKGELSEATRLHALYFLAAIDYKNRLRRVR